MRRGRFVIDMYEFREGGENDVLVLDLVNDPRQGLGVPARSFSIVNHGGGAGRNFLFFQISDDGVLWDKISTVAPATIETYEPSDNIVLAAMRVWASNPGVKCSIRATSGEWTAQELRDYLKYERPSDSLKETILKAIEEGV